MVDERLLGVPSPDAMAQPVAVLTLDQIECIVLFDGATTFDTAIPLTLPVFIFDCWTLVVEFDLLVALVMAEESLAVVVVNEALLDLVVADIEAEVEPPLAPLSTAIEAIRGEVGLVTTGGTVVRDVVANFFCMAVFSRAILTSLLNRTDLECDDGLEAVDEDDVPPPPPPLEL